MDEEREVMPNAPRGNPYVLLAIEAALLLVVVFGDVGFDKPGRFGLDFGTALFLGAAFVAAWSYGVWCSVRRRAWPALALHLALPVLAFPFVRDL